MIREVIATGKTVEAAIDSGCEKLGLGRDEIDFEIIDMPRKGFLGLTNTPAKVRVFKEEPDPVAAPVVEAKPVEKKPVAEAKPVIEKKAEKAVVIEEKVEAEPVAEEKKVYNLGNKVDVAVRYVEDILKGMGLDNITVTHTVSENVLNIKLEGDVSGAAIGRRGETLDALQYLAGLTANRGEGDYMRIVIDSGNYRDKRRNTLEQLAKKLANSVIRSGRSTTLEPMNPYERRIIHSTIADIKGVTSSSIGEEPNRCVVISSTNPNAARSFEGKGKGGRNYNRGGKGGDRRNGRGGRGPRREKPAPYQETSKREVPPAEAANQPLYGKIEL